MDKADLEFEIRILVLVPELGKNYWQGCRDGVPKFQWPSCIQPVHALIAEVSVRFCDAPVSV